MARKKRGNAKIPVIHEMLSGAGESSSAAIRPIQRDAPQSSLGRAEPLPRFSSGFFQGSTGVEVNGGRFNQTHGHQTNVTIHVNGQREEESELLQHHPQASTSHLPAPVDPSLTTHPPVITRISYTPDNSNKIYERHLALKKRGFPLWIPEPNSQLPMTYRRRGIHIGDVGIITPSGGFSFLFNICRPPGDPINPSTLPEGFSPIYPPLEPIDVRRFSEFKSDSYLASGTIERINNNPPFPGLSFETSANEGAILAVPEGAIALDLQNISRFRAYAATNIEHWYRYVNGPRGMEAKNGEVRLVIGCDMTTSWGMAAVANVSQHKTHYLKFRAIEEASTTSSSPIPLYRWEYSGMAEARVGPDLAEIEELKRSDDSEELGGRYMNQCLFVRTLNMTLNDDVFEALNRDVEAALIKEFLRYQPGASHTTRNNHANSKITQTGGSTEPSRMQPQTESQRDSSETSTGAIGAISQVQDHRVVTSLSPSAQKFHPADFLNKAILKKAPHSRLAITQDMDWYSVFTEDDKCVPPLEEIATRVLAAHYIREEDGVAYLEPKDARLLSSEHIKRGSAANGKSIAAADNYSHNKIISEQSPASLKPAKKKSLAANELEPLVIGRESRPETIDNSDEADNTSADVTTDHEEQDQPQKRTESTKQMTSLNWESDFEDFGRQNVQFRRTHSSYYPAQDNAGKKRANPPQPQDLSNAFTLDLKAVHDADQRELFVKLPPSSYQDPAKSRGGSAGLLTRLMSLDPQLFPVSHPIRRRVNFRASSTPENAPALPVAQTDTARMSAICADSLEAAARAAEILNPVYTNSSSSDDHAPTIPKVHPISNDVPLRALVSSYTPQIDNHSETTIAPLGRAGNKEDEQEEDVDDADADGAQDAAAAVAERERAQEQEQVLRAARAEERHGRDAERQQRQLEMAAALNAPTLDNASGTSSKQPLRFNIGLHSDDGAAGKSEGSGSAAVQGAGGDAVASRKGKERAMEDEAAQEAQSQRKMFVKLRSISFQDLAKARTGSVGGSAQLLNPYPELFPVNYPDRQNFSEEIYRGGVSALSSSPMADNASETSSEWAERFNIQLGLHSDDDAGGKNGGSWSDTIAAVQEAESDDGASRKGKERALDVSPNDAGAGVNDAMLVKAMQSLNEPLLPTGKTRVQVMMESYIETTDDEADDGEWSSAELPVNDGVLHWQAQMQAQQEAEEEQERLLLFRRRWQPVRPSAVQRVHPSKYPAANNARGKQAIHMQQQERPPQTPARRVPAGLQYNLTLPPPQRLGSGHFVNSASMGGDHKCPVCQATFTRPQHVARHMRSHTGDRPYKCQHCGDQFARSDLLSRHVNKFHARDPTPYSLLAATEHALDGQQQTSKLNPAAIQRTTGAGADRHNPLSGAKAILPSVVQLQQKGKPEGTSQITQHPAPAPQQERDEGSPAQDARISKNKSYADDYQFTGW